MHNEHDNLSKIIKNARQQSDFTIEELASKIGVTERYLYRIENENKKPSFDVLYKLIRALSISPELIFYPEKNDDISEYGYPFPSPSSQTAQNLPLTVPSPRGDFCSSVRQDFSY